MIQALLFLFGLGRVGRVRNLGSVGRVRNLGRVERLGNLVIDANYSLNTYSCAACLKGLKGTKRAKRHPCQSLTTGYRNNTPDRGIALFAHLALTFDKFCCTRHSQGESQEGYTTFLRFLFCSLPSFA